jgi:hypothetical protein
MSGTMQLIATTDEHGLHVDREQLERAGIKPGSRALVEIRPYTEEDWVADGERTFENGEEFLAYLGACPAHREDAVTLRPSPSAADTTMRDGDC